MHEEAAVVIEKLGRLERAVQIEKELREAHIGALSLIEELADELKEHRKALAEAAGKLRLIRLKK